ncbi:uncharacterized protein LOC131691755 [Topomyia yanbarensis]|uniref:uncharacterized protein LOC131691755 n=1 Tax=Topomyia yanbarensis TaxID=2498891 RepID=UPI00273B452E|nr:uncharacterized protein LOC131691755 [Topomyia yanbarensis]
MRKIDLVVLVVTVIILLVHVPVFEARRVKRQQSNRSPFSTYIPLNKKFVRNRPLPPRTTIQPDLTTILETRLHGLPPPFESKEPSRSRDFYICLASCLTLSHYNPVCGTDHTTYHNVYKLDCANRCGARPRVQVRKPGIC